MIEALRSRGRFADALNGRQEKPQQNRNDGNHDQQLNQCETNLFP
jgi:hypothetical protein